MIKPEALTGRIQLKNVTRSRGIPEYRGWMELIKERDGFVVVNELLLEEYLYSVVPSEMPASYGMEALKAQAICARTYAYGHMQHAAYPVYGAHVDDSTSFQVYNNIMEQKSTTQAVKETCGQLLRAPEGEIAETYYYATSCGVGSDAHVWKTENAKQVNYLEARGINEDAMEAVLAASSKKWDTIGDYLRKEEHFAEFIMQENPKDFEVQEGWYRWSYQVDELSAEHISEVLKACYKTRPELVLTKNAKGYFSEQPKDFSQVTDLYIAARGSGGVAEELILETDSGTYKVITEHYIRYVLCDGKTAVTLSNGEQVKLPDLLPSGFFILEKKYGNQNENVVGYLLTGGGFGHGAGMSQNAARHMAEEGYTCEEILLFFFKDCYLQALY